MGRRRNIVVIALIALVVVAWPLAVLLWRTRRERARRRTTCVAEPAISPAAAASARPVPTTAVAASAGTTFNSRTRRLPRSASLSTTLVCAALLLLVGLPTTWATLNDPVTMAQVSVGGGTVDPPTGLGATQTPTAARVSWTAPATGLTPDGYDVFRSTTSGSYGASIGSAASSPYDDTTAVECTPYYYKARSSKVNLDSALSTSEASVTLDRTGPTVSSGRVAFDPTPLAKVFDYVRVSGGNFEVYTNVTDNCDAAGAGTVTITLGAPFSTTVPAVYSAVGYTPVGGGPTFNYKYGPYALPAATLTNGQAVTWTVNATDTHGNVTNTAGTTFTADGVGPTALRGEMVSAYTNFYDATLGYGEVPSDGTQAATGTYVYGTATDPSGISSITANLDLSVAFRLKTGVTALALAPGTYTTLTGEAWSFRSAATVLNTALADGTRNFTITATDALGNAAVTSANQPVEIDDTVPSAALTTCTNGGTNNNILASPDYTDFNFGDTIYPPSLEVGWTGALQTATANLRNGTTTNDFFDFNTDFGLQMFQGTTQTTSFNLALNVVAATLAFTNSTLSMPNRTTVRFSYQTASQSGMTNGNARAYLSANIRDAAGNKATAAYSETCARNNW